MDVVWNDLKVGRFGKENKMNSKVVLITNVKNVNVRAERQYDAYGLKLESDEKIVNVLCTPDDRDNVCYEFDDIRRLKSYLGCMFDIKKVIFNGPATIVLWDDGTKTVVKCTEGDTYDKRVALMYAIMKKQFGNNSRLNKFLDKWCEDCGEVTDDGEKQ